MMSPSQIAVLWAALLVVMLACRTLPLVLLRGRSLPARVERAIGMIPAAAFSALVANDLLQFDTFASDPRRVLVVFASAGVVCVVARRSGSLLWCALTGMGVYALLGLVV